MLCNLLASLLMHKYNAHGATDVGGYGLLGHANNLANIQKNEVGFVIHNLPVIAKMAAVSKACGNMFGLLQGHAAETSGNFALCGVLGKNAGHLTECNMFLHFVTLTF